MARKEKIEMMMIMQEIDTDAKNTFYEINHQFLMEPKSFLNQILTVLKLSIIQRMCATAH